MRNYVLGIYNASKGFPKEERYGLVSQLRRAAISITSNVSEGFGRHSAKEKIRFYSISLGSISEIQNQLIIARDVGYIKPQNFNTLFKKSIIVHKLVNGLVRGAQSRFN